MHCFQRQVLTRSNGMHALCQVLSAKGFDQESVREIDDDGRILTAVNKRASKTATPTRIAVALCGLCWWRWSKYLKDDTKSTRNMPIEHDDKTLSLTFHGL